MEESIKALKGTELTEGRKIFFEVQGPYGELKTQENAGMSDNVGFLRPTVSHSLSHITVTAVKSGLSPKYIQRHIVNANSETIRLLPIFNSVYF